MNRAYSMASEDSSSASKQDTIRFALVGCGRISANHILALGTHREECELVSVCDTDRTARSRIADETGAVAYAELGDMLVDSPADVVILTTPSGLHAGQTVAAAQSGRHVVTEKPMATRWEDGKRMVNACEEAGVQLFVVKQVRQNRTLRALRQALKERRFGRVNIVNINVFWTRPHEYYAGSRWRGTWHYDGGALMNQASHYVDLLEWLFGPVESVHAFTATLGRDIEAEDTATVSIKWRSGALGSLNVTMLTYPRNLESSITVLGERGTVRISGQACNVIEHWEFADKREDEEVGRLRDGRPGMGECSGHALYYENVIQALRGSAAPETDGREGLKSLELLIAAYTSSRNGVRVGLPLEF